MGGQKAGDDVLVYIDAEFDDYHDEFESAVLTAEELKEIEHKYNKLVEVEAEVNLWTRTDVLLLPWNEVTIKVIKKSHVVNAFKTLKKESLRLKSHDFIVMIRENYEAYGLPPYVPKPIRKKVSP